MTKDEAKIITAYTGILIGEFSEFHKYAEELLNRPVCSHEFGDRNVVELIKAKSKDAFVNLEVK